MPQLGFASCQLDRSAGAWRKRWVKVEINFSSTFHFRFECVPMVTRDGTEWCGLGQRGERCQEIGQSTETGCQETRNLFHTELGFCLKVFAASLFCFARNGRALKGARDRWWCYWSLPFLLATWYRFNLCACACVCTCAVYLPRAIYFVFKLKITYDYFLLKSIQSHYEKDSRSFNLRQKDFITNCTLK